MNLFLIIALAVLPENGSLLFIENGNRIVQRHTDSTFTHVAIILKEDDKFYVYEAVKPKVRKLVFEDYCQEIEKLNKNKREQRKIWLANPKTALTDNENLLLKQYLKNQIGRKYSINSYLHEESGTGIHCGELAEEALNVIGRQVSDNPSKDAPVDVLKNIKIHYKTKELF